MTIEILRMVERLVAVGFGGVSLVLGFKLFMLGGDDAQRGQVEFFKIFKIKALQFGPGLFFALFGAWILITSLHSEVTVSHPRPDPVDGQKPGEFQGLMSLPSTVQTLDAQEALKVVTELEKREQVFLSAPEGRQANERLRELKKHLVSLEWKDSPEQLKRFFQMLDRGLDVPADDQVLAKMNSMYQGL